MVQLPFDCMNEILEYFVHDLRTLKSCLLVNRHWCKATVRIYWRNIINYKTLIACLPNESRGILKHNGILISAPNPMINYASFCKFLNMSGVSYHIERFLKEQRPTLIQNLDDSIVIVTREILKLFMSQIYSLKELNLLVPSSQITLFTSYLGARDCLKNISELQVYSDIFISYLKYVIIYKS